MQPCHCCAKRAEAHRYNFQHNRATASKLLRCTFGLQWGYQLSARLKFTPRSRRIYLETWRRAMCNHNERKKFPKRLDEGNYLECYMLFNWWLQCCSLVLFVFKNSHYICRSCISLGRRKSMVYWAHQLNQSVWVKVIYWTKWKRSL